MEMLRLTSLLLLGWLALPCPISAASYPSGEVDEDLVSTVYQGGEKLVFDVSWSGGIKIGELYMEVNRLAESPARYELRTRVIDSGLFHYFYPIDDTFVTVVEGAQRLPVSYQVHQKEGGSYEARRRTDYYQDRGQVHYQKNDLAPEMYQVEGTVHNEFSSFFFTRIMHLDQKQPVIVPTFADGKRHEVEVRTGQAKVIPGTVRGDVRAIPVMPIMKFKGLYDKAGATVTWFTDDLCRVPIRITSELLIGSLVAELISYSNPFCPETSTSSVETPERRQQEMAMELGD